MRVSSLTIRIVLYYMCCLMLMFLDVHHSEQHVLSVCCLMLTFLDVHHSEQHVLRVLFNVDVSRCASL